MLSRIEELIIENNSKIPFLVIVRQFLIIDPGGLRLVSVVVGPGSSNDNSVYSGGNDGELIINQLYTKLIQKSILQSVAFLNWTINHILNKHISGIFKELITFCKIEKSEARGDFQYYLQLNIIQLDVLSIYWLTIYITHLASGGVREN